MSLENAINWCERGYFPVPIPVQEKGPKITGWQDLRITVETASQFFNGAPQNLGVLLGDNYGSADVDLDCQEAIAAAPLLLPPTGLMFGRQSKPSSHYFYRID